MKKLFAFCAMTSLVLGEAAPEDRVDRIDLTGFTCKQFLAMNRDDALIVVGWLQGYYLDEHAPPVVDFHDEAHNDAVVAQKPRQLCQSGVKEGCCVSRVSALAKAATTLAEPIDPA
jgi:hypothetical protein